MADIREQINLFLSKLSLQQKLLLGITAIVSFSLLFLLLSWTTRPNFEVLFSNLAQKDAGKIVEKLKEQNVEYQLENGGSTIKVPTDKVYDLRLSFAQEGLPENSGVGYEIFDKTNLGMTDFIQQVNYRRALEGELARTIEQMETVDRARVHIVIPKEALFKEDQKLTTASVILKLRGTGMPANAHIEGLCNLVSSSVEGLEPENITVMDTRGRILSNTHNPDDLVTLSSTQLEFSQKVENYLSRKAQTMLDQVVGPGNSVVRVTAELNFTQVEKSTEIFDPESATAISETITEESTPMGGETGGGAVSKRSNTSTNYEVNKTIERIVEGIGNVERLSVAVMVNNKRSVATDDDGNRQINYVPRETKEMETLSDLVRTAVGFQNDRGDEVSVVNVDFSIPTLEEELLDAEKPKFWEDWYNLVEKAFLILAILAAMFIMRSIFGQVKKRNDQLQKQIVALTNQPTFAQLDAPGGTASDPVAAETPEDKEEVIVAENFFRKVQSKDPLTKNLHQFLSDKPDEAARLVKVWISEDGDEGF